MEKNFLLDNIKRILRIDGRKYNLPTAPMGQWRGEQK
jgi:hypothetical protein